MATHLTLDQGSPGSNPGRAANTKSGEFFLEDKKILEEFARLMKKILALSSKG